VALLKVVSVLLVVTLYAKNGSLAEDTRGVSSALVQMEIVPLHERFCDDYTDSGTIHLISRLRFTNVSPQALLFYKASGTVYGIRAAKTVADLHARKLEFETFPFVMSNRPLLSHVITEWQRPNPKQFVTLRPGSSFEDDELIPVPYKLGDSNAPYALGPGEHFIQIDAETWPESSDLGKMLRRNWQKGGSSGMRRR
jgi:hypothetical protein